MITLFPWISPSTTGVLAQHERVVGDESSLHRRIDAERPGSLKTAVNLDALLQENRSTPPGRDVCDRTNPTPCNSPRYVVLFSHQLSIEAGQIVLIVVLKSQLAGPAWSEWVQDYFGPESSLQFLNRPLRIWVNQRRVAISLGFQLREASRSTWRTVIPPRATRRASSMRSFGSRIASSARAWPADNWPSSSKS